MSLVSDQIAALLEQIKEMIPSAKPGECPALLGDLEQLKAMVLAASDESPDSSKCASRHDARALSAARGGCRKIRGHEEMALWPQEKSPP